MRLIFMAHSIQILSSHGFLYDNSKDTNDDYQQLKTKNKNNDDAELQIIQKLVEKIMKHQT
jgi:hypothetical protein